MKSKLLFVLLCLATLLGAFTLTSCEDATATPKTETPVDTGGATGLFVLDYAVDTDFVIQVWETTCDLTDGADGGSRVTAKAVGWAGGSFAFHEGGLNFTTVKSVKFKVRSNLLLSQIKYILQTGATDTVSKYLSATTGVTLTGTLSETTWTDVVIDVSAATGSTTVTSGFAFVFDPAPIAAGKWAEFKGIDWVDANGTSVNIAQ